MARLDVDDWLEIAVELEDVRRRVGEVAIRVKEMIAQQRGPTTTGTAGLPCVAEITWDEVEEEIAKHDVAPPPDGFSAHDDPPSRPVEHRVARPGFREATDEDLAANGVETVFDENGKPVGLRVKE